MRGRTSRQRVRPAWRSGWWCVPLAVGLAAAVAAAELPPTSVSAPSPAPVPSLRLSLAEAIVQAMGANRGLAVSRLDPAIQRTFEGQAQAVFDPTVQAELSRSRTEVGNRSTTDEWNGSAGVSQTTPAGTTLAAGLDTTYVDSSAYVDERATARLGVTVTQALLQGRSVAANRVSIHQAQLDTEVSEYEVRGVAEALAADVETCYWDTVLAARQMAIYEQSLKLAEQQLRETRERVDVGTVPATELAAAEAEVALRHEALIKADGALAKSRLRLLHFLNPAGPDVWQQALALTDEPAVPTAQLADVTAHVAVARALRADLNQARLAIQRQELEVVRTRHGVLPKLDLFISLGKTGYADTFGGTVEDLHRESFDAEVGLRFLYPVGNRDARLRRQRAVLSREQAQESLANLEQLAELDVRCAYIDVQHARESVTASAASRRLREESLRAESEKFRVGRSTSYLVAQAQRELVDAQIGEIRAVIAYLQSFTSLYRLEGALLERRGISAPGRRPPTAAITPPPPAPAP